MRFLIILFSCLPAAAGASEPTGDSIDYAAPEQYTAIPASLGNRERIVEQAIRLTGRDDRATVRKVLEWMETSFTYNPKAAYEWRNFDDVIEQGCYGGCADQGIVCGVLLRAAGIPTVWVKTMDVSWIWDFKKGRPYESWSGHVFLEVYLDNRWVLLDPGAKLIYADYSPEMRILPGNRFAYHKGDNPKQMIMSLQWEEWKQQTRAYFEQLDSSLLPVDTEGGISVVPRVYIVGNDPYYKVLTKMAQSKGWSVQKSFNTDYEKLLPLAVGETLLIETHRMVPIVPIEFLDKIFPGASAGLESDSGVVTIDRTTIMFVDFARPLDVLDEEDAR